MVAAVITSEADVQAQETQVPPRRNRRPVQNMSMRDRWLAGTAAGAALAAALQCRPSWARLALGAGAGVFFGWAWRGHCSVYRWLGINTATQGRAAPEDFYDRGIHVVHTLSIERPAEDLYHYWRDLTNLPIFMRHLRSISVLDDRRSHWVAAGPAGTNVEWDAVILDDVPGALIAWRSMVGADVDHAGSVRFVNAGPRRTHVTVNLDYIPPAGRLGYALAKVFGQEPRQQIAQDLHRFKQIMEAGESTPVEDQPQGTC